MNRPTIALLLLLMLATGARPSEITGLSMNDVDFSNHRIRLQSKGGPERQIRLSDPVWERVISHIQNTFGDIPQDGLQRIFYNQKGRPLISQTLRTQLYQLERETGIKLDGLMAFRHKFATDCLECGVPIRVFQYLMGHKGLSEKSRYQHVKQDFHHDEIQKAFSKIPWKDGLNGKALK